MRRTGSLSWQRFGESGKEARVEAKEEGIGVELQEQREAGMLRE